MQLLRAAFFLFFKIAEDFNFRNYLIEICFWYLLFNIPRFKADQFFIFKADLQFNRIAANFAVLNVRLMTNGRI